MTDSAKIQIDARQAELSALVEAHPIYIPVRAVADFLHMKEEGLRASIEQGSCPFGLCWRAGDRMAYKIPTMTFFAWFSKGMA